MGAMGFYLRVGDQTTCGGKILTGDETLSWYGMVWLGHGKVTLCRVASIRERIKFWVGHLIHGTKVEGWQERWTV